MPRGFTGLYTLWCRRLDRLPASARYRLVPEATLADPRALDRLLRGLPADPTGTVLLLPLAHPALTAAPLLLQPGQSSALTAASAA